MIKITFKKTLNPSQPAPGIVQQTCFCIRGLHQLWHGKGDDGDQDDHGKGDDSDYAGEPWWPQLDLTLARDFATYTALHSNSQVKMLIAMLILCRSSLTMVMTIQSLSVKEGERLWILNFRRMSNILKFQGLNGSQPLASLSAKVGKQGGTPPLVVWFLCAMVIKYENKGGGLLVEWCANYTRTWPEQYFGIFWELIQVMEWCGNFCLSGM